MQGRVKQFYTAVKWSFKDFFNSDPLNHSAVIAFYTIFSLPGILIIAAVVAGIVYEDARVTNELTSQISRLAGADTAKSVAKILENASQAASGIIPKIVGIGTLLFSATTVVVSLQDSLNSIWHIKAKPEKGFIKFLVNRVLSLAMVIGIGFLLLVSLLLDALLVVFNDYIETIFSGFALYVINGINLFFSLVVVTVVFAMLFKFLPDAQVKWKDTWIGAIITMLLFVLGKYAIGFYLGTSSLATTYGAAGSLVLLLIWVYYSSLIVLFGAQFTLSYSHAKGRRIRPKQHAVWVRVNEVEEGDFEKRV